MKKLVTLVLLLVFVLAMVPMPAVAMSGSCERFSSCGGPADCAWWGIRCAISDPWAFGDITGEYW